MFRLVMLVCRVRLRLLLLLGRRAAPGGRGLLMGLVGWRLGRRGRGVVSEGWLGGRCCFLGMGERFDGIYRSLFQEMWSMFWFMALECFGGVVL